MTGNQLKNTILQEAIEGRLVPQDPNDEPSSVLLDKIRKEKARLVKEGKLKKKDLIETPIEDDEIPFKIPDSWEWVRIGSLCQVLDIDHRMPAKVTNGFPYISPLDFYGINGINYDNAKKISVEDFECLSRKCLPRKGDIIFPRYGTIGIVRLVDTDRDFLVSYSCATIKMLSGNLQSKYLYYVLQSPFIRLIEIDKYINKTTQPNVGLQSILKFLFPLPPLAEQKRIVAKIEELLPKVEEYGKAQEALDKLNEELPERLKKSILQEAIEGRLVPQDPNDEPASVLLDKIRKEKTKLVKEGKLKKKDLEEIPISEDEIPFKIPESWEWVRFGTIVKSSTGKTPERGNSDFWSKGDYPWVSISDMKQGETIMTTKENISALAAEKCFGNQISPKGSLIMSFKLTVGRTSFLGIDAYHNEAIITIKTMSDPLYYMRNYFSHILPIISNWGETKDAIKGKTLNSKSIYNLLIPLPPYKEQYRIVTKIEQLMNEIDKLKV